MNEKATHIRLFCAAAGIDLDDLLRDAGIDPLGPYIRGDEPKMPGKAKYKVKASDIDSKYGDDSDDTQPNPGVGPATTLDCLLSNFDNELQYLHAEITRLRFTLRDHLPIHEFDDDDGAKEAKENPAAYNDTGVSQSPVEQKIAKGMNSLVDARTRIERLRNLVVT
jgi:phosphotransferase system IIB component